MNEWALLKNGQIMNVITAAKSKSEIQQRYPDFQVADVYSLPSTVQERYQYWNERP